MGTIYSRFVAPSRTPRRASGPSGPTWPAKRAKRAVARGAVAFWALRAQKASLGPFGPELRPRLADYDYGGLGFGPYGAKSSAAVSKRPHATARVGPFGPDLARFQRAKRAVARGEVDFWALRAQKASLEARRASELRLRSRFGSLGFLGPFRAQKSSAAGSLGF